MSYPKKSTEDPCASTVSDNNSQVMDPNRTWIGQPDHVSKIRPIRMRQPENESFWEENYRKEREAAQKWNDIFWTKHNTLFEKRRDQFLAKTMKQQNISKAEAVNSEIMSKFYKEFLDERRKVLLDYNWIPASPMYLSLYDCSCEYNSGYNANKYCSIWTNGGRRQPMSYPKKSTEDPCTSTVSDKNSQVMHPNRTWIGQPDHVSKIRPIRMRQPENESFWEENYRKEREAAQKWNDIFWTKHNTLFEKRRDQFLAKTMKEQNISKAEAVNSEIMSKFYKEFLDERRKVLLDYNWTWYRKNSSILWPAFRAQLSRLKKLLR